METRHDPWYVWLRLWRTRFLSRREKMEMLEEYRESLKNELEGVEEELKMLKQGA